MGDKRNKQIADVVTLYEGDPHRIENHDIDVSEKHCVLNDIQERILLVFHDVSVRLATDSRLIGERAELTVPTG